MFYLACALCFSSMVEIIEMSDHMTIPVGYFCDFCKPFFFFVP